MALEYPSQLPTPLRDGYALQTTSPLQRTTMDSGRSRQRRRFASVPTVASVTWLFTTPQAQIFESWYMHTILDGAEWFQCPLKTPVGLEHYEARFVDIYSGPQLRGRGLWLYSAQIELKNRQVIPIEWVEEAPEWLANSGLFDITMNREWPQA